MLLCQNHHLQIGWKFLLKYILGICCFYLGTAIIPTQLPGVLMDHSTLWWCPPQSLSLSVLLIVTINKVPSYQWYFSMWYILSGTSLVVDGLLLVALILVVFFVGTFISGTFVMVHSCNIPPSKWYLFEWYPHSGGTIIWYFFGWYPAFEWYFVGYFYWN